VYVVCLGKCPEWPTSLPTGPGSVPEASNDWGRITGETTRSQHRRAEVDSGEASAAWRRR
jgi:hypothetical protein